MVELVGVAHFAPARVVAILLSSARIAPRCLQVPAFVAADPDIGPGRRDRERPDPLERVLGRHFLVLRVEVFESLAGVAARVALLAIAGIAQTPGGRGTLAAAWMGAGHGNPLSPRDPIGSRGIVTAVAARWRLRGSRVAREGCGGARGRDTRRRAATRSRGAVCRSHRGCAA